jgi:predicted HTH domain antitoxin
MSILISDDILQSTQISETELKREIAIFLFQKNKLGLTQAQELAEIPMVDFQQELANRGIPISVNTNKFPLRNLPLYISPDFDEVTPGL